MAESGLKTAKRIKQAKESKTDVFLVILDHRNKPCKAMYEAHTSSKPDEPSYKDTSVHNRQSVGAENDIVGTLRYETANDDQHAKELQPLRVRDVVRTQPFQKHGRNEWKQGVVTKRLDERWYQVEKATNTYR